MKIVITLEPMKPPIAENTSKRMEIYAEVEQLGIKYKDQIATVEMIGRN